MMPHHSALRYRTTLRDNGGGEYIKAAVRVHGAVGKTATETKYASRAVLHPGGGQPDLVRPPTRAPHGGALHVR